MRQRRLRVDVATRRSRASAPSPGRRGASRRLVPPSPAARRGGGLGEPVACALGGEAEVAPRATSRARRRDTPPALPRPPASHGLLERVEDACRLAVAAGAGTRRRFSGSRRACGRRSAALKSAAARLNQEPPRKSGRTARLLDSGAQRGEDLVADRVQLLRTVPGRVSTPPDSSRKQCDIVPPLGSAARRPRRRSARCSPRTRGGALRHPSRSLPRSRRAAVLPCRLSAMKRTIRCSAAGVSVRPVSRKRAHDVERRAHEVRVPDVEKLPRLRRSRGRPSPGAARCPRSAPAPLRSRAIDRAGSAADEPDQARVRGEHVGGSRCATTMRASGYASSRRSSQNKCGGDFQHPMSAGRRTPGAAAGTGGAAHRRGACPPRAAANRCRRATASTPRSSSSGRRAS